MNDSALSDINQLCSLNDELRWNNKEDIIVRKLSAWN